MISACQYILIWQSYMLLLLIIIILQIIPFIIKVAFIATYLLLV